MVTTMRWGAVAITAAVLAGCGAGGPRRDDDQAKLPVERDAVEGGTTACDRPLPTPSPGVTAPAGTPFLPGTVWFARETTTGSDVHRAYAPAAGARDAAEELADLARRAGSRIEGLNGDAARSALTYDDGRSVNVVVTTFCDGYVELAYHFATTGGATPS